jgi:hypothetical protein
MRKRVDCPWGQLKLRGGLGAAALVCASLVTLAVLAPTTVGAPNSTPLPCSSRVLAGEAWSIESNVGTEWASEQGAASLADGLIVNGSVLSTNFTYVGVFFGWNWNPAACAVLLATVNAVFDTHISGAPAQVTVVQGATNHTVERIELMVGLTSTLSHTPDLWSGWSFDIATQDSDADAQWYVPDVSWPSWGCPWDEAYICLMSPWVGVTVESNGDSGIAQAGTSSAVICVLPDFDCINGHDGWVEFYQSSTSTPMNCLSVSPGDSIYAYASYYTPTYFAFVGDVNSGNACSSQQSMNMGGPPVYAEVVVENEPNSFGGGYFPAPDFGEVNFFNLLIGEVGDALTLSPADYGPGDHVALPSALAYNTGLCAGQYTTCFNIDQS